MELRATLKEKKRIVVSSGVVGIGKMSLESARSKLVLPNRHI